MDDATDDGQSEAPVARLRRLKEFGEKRGIRLQVQAYNVFNHPEFNSVGTSIQWDATGKRNSIADGIFNGTLPARILAFGARFEF